MITTVIFDLDDTLYEERDYCKSGFATAARAIAQQYDRISTRQASKTLWTLFNAGNHTTTFNAALEKLTLEYNDQTIKNLIQIYRSHTPNIKLPCDSRTVLDQLKPLYTLALLSDGFLPAQSLKVQALGIEAYFQCIVYTEQLGREFWKPSPAGFQKIMQELNVNPERMVYVADNQTKDFIGPNELGILSIQLIRPNRLHTGTSSHNSAAPDYIIHKITDLPDLLKKV